MQRGSLGTATGFLLFQNHHPCCLGLPFLLLDTWPFVNGFDRSRTKDWLGNAIHGGWVFLHWSCAIRSRSQLESEVCTWSAGGCHWTSEEATIVSHTETSKDKGHVTVAGDSPPGTVGRVEKLWVWLQPLPPKQK